MDSEKDYNGKIFEALDAKYMLVFPNIHISLWKNTMCKKVTCHLCEDVFDGVCPSDVVFDKRYLMENMTLLFLEIADPRGINWYLCARCCVSGNFYLTSSHWNRCVKREFEICYDETKRREHEEENDTTTTRMDLVKKTELLNIY